GSGIKTVVILRRRAAPSRRTQGIDGERRREMAVKVGDRVPAGITLRHLGPDGVKAVTTDEFFAGKKVALFALPGAYTRTCSSRHLPGYVQNAASLQGKGIDTIACLSVNDAFVMDAWGKEHGAGGKVVMLGDGSCEFTEAMGLTVDR